MTTATETIIISRPTGLVLDGLEVALSRIEKDIEQARQDCRDAGLEFNPISDVFGPLFAAQTWLAESRPPSIARASRMTVDPARPSGHHHAGRRDEMTNLGTLAQFESRIAELERLEAGEIPCDQYGDPEFESRDEMAAAELASIAGEIRSIAWNASVSLSAQVLASRAIDPADRIARENGRIGGYASRLEIR